MPPKSKRNSRLWMPSCKWNGIEAQAKDDFSAYSGTHLK
jgi:hypothetical protein